MAGGVGFLVDLGVLLLLAGLLGPIYARGISFAAAVLSTWLINRKLAFAGYSSGQSMFSEWLRYFVLMLVGGGINLLIYTLLVLFIEGSLGKPGYALAMGSLGGLVANFLLSRYALFNRTAVEPAERGPCQS